MKRSSRSCSLACSQDRISSIFPRTTKARRRLISGDTRVRPLIHKLVKPIKVAGSWFSNKVRADQFLVTQTEAQMRAAHTSVLGKTDAAVGKELARFDLANGCFDQATVLPALFFRNGAFQILNLRMILPHEDHERHLGDSTDPGITNQLGIQGQQPSRFFRVATRGGLPVEQA